MRRVFKYPIPIDDYFTLELPKWSQILRVLVQNDRPVLYAAVPTVDLKEKVDFRLAGTGHPLEDEEFSKLTYIDSFMMANGALVFHLFRVDEKEGSVPGSKRVNPG